MRRERERLILHDSSKRFRGVFLHRREVSVVFQTGTGITEWESGRQTLETQQSGLDDLTGLADGLLLGGWELVDWL